MEARAARGSVAWPRLQPEQSPRMHRPRRQSDRGRSKVESCGWQDAFVARRAGPMENSVSASTAMRGGGRIVVAGAGYAGLHVALRLTTKLRDNPAVELTLI